MVFLMWWNCWAIVLPLLFAIDTNPVQVFGQLCLTEPFCNWYTSLTMQYPNGFDVHFNWLFVSYMHVNKYFVTRTQHLYHGVPAPQDVGACAESVLDWLKLRWLVWGCIELEELWRVAHLWWRVDCLGLPVCINGGSDGIITKIGDEISCGAVTSI